MCLGVPAEVREVRGDIVLVDFGDGVLREVYGGVIDDIRPGDLVVVHAGVIIEKLKTEKTREMIEALREFIEDIEVKATEILEWLEGGGRQ